MGTLSFLKVLKVLVSKKIFGIDKLFGETYTEGKKGQVYTPTINLTAENSQPCTAFKQICLTRHD